MQFSWPKDYVDDNGSSDADNEQDNEVTDS